MANKPTLYGADNKPLPVVSVGFRTVGQAGEGRKVRGNARPQSAASGDSWKTQKEGEVMRRIALFVLGLIIMASTVYALDAPLLSLKRLTVAGGANYAWYGGAEAPTVLSFDKEFTAGLYAGYNMTPHLSLAGASVYGFDNKQITTYIGVRLRLYVGSE